MTVSVVSGMRERGRAGQQGSAPVPDHTAPAIACCPAACQHGQDMGDGLDCVMADTSTGRADLGGFIEVADNPAEVGCHVLPETEERLSVAQPSPRPRPVTDPCVSPLLYTRTPSSPQWPRSAGRLRKPQWVVA